MVRRSVAGRFCWGWSLIDLDGDIMHMGDFVGMHICGGHAPHYCTLRGALHKEPTTAAGGPAP